MAAERDSQRGKLYKAENAALDAFATPLREVKDVERYIRRQLRRQTLRARYGAAVDLTAWPIKVGDGRGTQRAMAHGTGLITLPLWARKDWVVLHECAHIIHERLAVRHRRIAGAWRACAPGTRTTELKGGAAHGWQYAAIYLDLVRFCMGREAADALKASFREHHVRFRPKRKAPAGAAERFAAMRAAAKREGAL